MEETACSYLPSYRCETPLKILNIGEKTTELEFLRKWLAGERRLERENRDQIWNQRAILHLEGEFQVNRGEKVEKLGLHMRFFPENVKLWPPLAVNSGGLEVNEELGFLLGGRRHFVL